MWIGPLRIHRFTKGIEFDLFGPRRTLWLALHWGSRTVDR